MSEEKKPFACCNNCQHAGEKFQVDEITHLHCKCPAVLEKLGENFKPKRTLRLFFDTCENHEFKSEKP